MCHPRSHPLFQFHKVRLKDAEDKHRNQAAAFQFHKVRLKESLVRINHVADGVSIPQGTIKRERPVRVSLLADTFQFHKVRLKV